MVDLSASSSITIYSLCVKLDFSFFVSCFINALISFSIRSIDVLIVWCVFWRVLFSSFLIFKGTYSFGWLTVLMQVSSLKWSRSLINRKKFVNSKKNDFCYIFLKWVWKESKCFDKFTTFSHGSDSYISKFVFAPCSLIAFPLFLKQNSVPLTIRCWFQYGLLRWIPTRCFLVQDVLPCSQYV